MGTIDAFTHMYPPGYLDALKQVRTKEAREAEASMRRQGAKNRNLVDLESRLLDLDKYKIDVQITAVSRDPNEFSVTCADQLRLCRVVNEGMAKVTQGSKGKVEALGAVPLACMEEGGVDEMRRAINDLGLKGFMVPTNVHGKAVDSFERFWAEASRLGAAVYIHPIDPVGTTGRRYEDEFDLVHVIGWPFETALVLSRLVFTGTLEKYPNLRILSHHLGGLIPFLAGRIDESYARSWVRRREDQVAAARRSEKPSDDFRRFYYDTAIGGSIAALRCGYEVFGADRMVFSTDYPWGPDCGRGRLANYPKLVRGLRLSPKESRQVFEGNALELLGM